MINNILVPTDFSAVADNALQYALKLAKEAGAKVHLLHVKSVPVADAYFAAGAYLQYMEEMDKLAKEGLNRLKDKFYGKTDIPFKATAITGSVYEEIKAYVKKNKIDLVLMGTTGASSFAGMTMGSNAATVVSLSEVPVLVIPPSARYRKLHHIVYSTDYNEPEFPAFSRLIYLAELYNAGLTVLHVRSENDRYFNAAHNFFVRNKKHISWKKLKIAEMDGPVMESINQFVREKKADMLVVAKHNRGFFDRLFHRSLSKRMAYHTKTPLLVLNK